MAANQDVEINVGVDGVAKVVAGFAAIRAAGSRLSKTFEGVGKGVQSDFSRITSSARSAAGILGTLGGAAAGISFTAAIGSLGLLTAALRTASTLTQDMAAQVDSLEKEAPGSLLKGAQEVGALKHMMKSSGIDEDETRPLMEMLNILRADVMKAQAEQAADDPAQLLANRMGVAWSAMVDEDGKKRDGLDYLKRFADGWKNAADQQDATVALAEHFGGELGPRLVNFLNLGSEGIEKLYGEYLKLSGLRADDAKIYAALNDEILRQETALWGVQNAFARGYTPALAGAAGAWAEFYVGTQGAAESIGSSIGGYLQTLTPELTRLSKTLADVISGGDLVTDSPIAGFFEKARDLAVGFSEALVDVLKWLNGDPPADWIQNLIDMFGKARDFAGQAVTTFREFRDFIANDVAPVVRSVWDAISNLLNLAGVESTGGQIAVVAAFVLLRGTIFGMLGTTLKIVKAFGDIAGLTPKIASGARAIANAGIGAAAVGAKTAAVVAGPAALLASGYAFKSMEEALEAIGPKLDEIQEKHGEAAAAAYLNAFIDNLSGAESWGNKLLNGLDWVTEAVGLEDLIGGEKDMRKVIDLSVQANPEQAKIGAALAMQDLGLIVGPDGTVSIGAGLEISGAELETALAELNDINVTLNVGNVTGLEEAVASQVAGMQAAPGARAAELSATQNLPQLSPTTIILPSGDPVGGVYMTEDAVGQISRASALSRRATS